MSRKPKTDDESMDAPVRVQLDDAAVAERGRALAEKLGIVATLRAQKKADGERIQTQIDGILDEAEELRLEILDGAAEKRQGDLFVHEAGSPDALPPAAATSTLAAIAAHARTPFEFTGDEPTEAPAQANAELEKSKRGGKGASA